MFKVKRIALVLVVFILGIGIGTFILAKARFPLLVKETNPSSPLTVPLPANWKFQEALPGNSFATAFDLTPGYDTEGTLNPGNILDYYVFSLKQPSKITVSVTNVPSDFAMAFYNNNFNEIGHTIRNGSIGGSTILSLQSGKYYIKVIGNYTEVTNNPYTIRLDIQSQVE